MAAAFALFGFLLFISWGGRALKSRPTTPLARSVANEDDLIHVYESGSAHDLRTWTMEPGEAIDHFAAPDLLKVSSMQIHQALVEARQVRRQRLSSYPRLDPGFVVLPKGANTRVTSVHMVLGDNAEVPSWRGGSFLSARAPDRRQLALIEQVALIGRIEGYRLDVQVDRANSTGWAALRRIPGVRIIENPAARDMWISDTVEMGRDHSVSLPAAIDDHALVLQAVFRERLRRIHPELSNIPFHSTLDRLRELIGASRGAAFEVLGRVAEQQSQASAVALALINRTSIRESLSYVEGGNLLLGVLPGGATFALIGRDSVAVSRALLERDLKRTLTESETLQIIGSDFGLALENVHPIEQPFEFHIDMASLVVGSTQALLNDAEESARLEEAWMREEFALKDNASSEEVSEHESVIAEMWAKSRIRAEGESRALKDLQVAGMTVYRIAGAFHDGPVRMNLLNAILGTGSSGHLFMIAYGADPRLENYFAKKLLLEIPTQIKRIYFLNREFSVPSGSGGINCRVKLEGDVISNRHE